MRLSRVRFTVRRMMVGVAVIAAVLAVASFSVKLRRRETIEERAAYHRDQAFRAWFFYRARYEQEVLGGFISVEYQENPDMIRSPEWYEQVRRSLTPSQWDVYQRAARRREYHKRMKAKWERAAEHPEKRVPPDAVLSPEDDIPPDPKNWDYMGRPPSPWTKDAF